MFHMAIIAVLPGSKQSREIYSSGRMSKWLILNLVTFKLTARLKRRVMSIGIFHDNYFEIRCVILRFLGFCNEAV
jgi:hypothetical protein